MSKAYTVQKAQASGLKLLILRPTKAAKDSAHTPGILWIHGGGYATGMAGMVYMSRALNLVRKYGAVVVSPAYRLAWKAPYPAALEDCYTALLYLKNHAAELGFNENQIMVGGESAGGGLTAGKHIAELLRHAHPLELLAIELRRLGGIIGQKQIVSAASAEAVQQLLGKIEKPVSQIQGAVHIKQKQLFASEQSFFIHPESPLFYYSMDTALRSTARSRPRPACFQKN